MKINTLIIVLILLVISFFSCQTNDKEDLNWSDDDKELLLNSCIANSTKDKDEAEKECDCFVKEAIIKTKNSNEFEKLTLEKVASLRDACDVSK